MNKERFKERILETENLTDELEDDDANWLIDWGIARLDTVLQGAADEETAGNRVNALMAVMRKINRIAGSYARQSPQDLAGELAALRDLFAAVSGSQDVAAGARAEATTKALTGAAKKKSWKWPWTAKKPPVEQPQPAPPSFEAAAAHLTILSPRQVLEYLANEFYKPIAPPAK